MAGFRSKGELVWRRGRRGSMVTRSQGDWNSAKHAALEAARSSMAPIRHTDGDPALDYGEFLCPGR